MRPRIMPIFEIRALPQDETFDTGAVMKKLVSTVAQETDIDRGTMWASWQEIPPGREDGEWENGDPVVRVISFEGETDERIERILDTAARVVADELRIEPRKICVTYEEAHSGRSLSGHGA
jgi:hypothetical protein